MSAYAASWQQLTPRLPHPHLMSKATWENGEPAKTKTELCEILTQVLRNPQPELKPRPPAKKDRDQASGERFRWHFIDAVVLATLIVGIHR